MSFFFLNSLHRSSSTLLLAGALLGAAAGACDPKTIGDETAGNAVCKQGETKPAGDGCNTCTCDGGEWACTEKACEACVDGETKPAEDGCNTCTCAAGEWSCTKIACPGTTSMGSDCVDGEMKMHEDGCNWCTCEGGQWGCTEKGCPSDTTGGETDSAGETETAGPGGECGDGVVDPGEQCDDGNAVGGDGCSASCALEGGADAIQICQEPFPQDIFWIKSAGIEGDALKLDVEYGGGCGTHEFTYCWDGIFLESSPVQISTKMSYVADDPCDAIVMDQLVFDLVPLKTDYQQAYQSQSGEILIGLAGWQDQLLYAF